MQLHVIRHGESIGNTKRGFISGASDPEGLTDKGKVQAIRLAWELRKTNFNRIISSPVARARQTADIIAFNSLVPIETNSAFSEIHHGIFEGHYWWEESLVDQVPRNWRTRRKENWNIPYPGGGESMKAMCQRVWKGLDDLLNNIGKREQLAIVSHQVILGAIKYWVEHDITKAKSSHVLNYLHTQHYSNATAFSIVQRTKRYIIKQNITNLEPVESSKYTIDFYTNHLFSHKHHNQITRLPTNSQNKVYEVLGRKPSIVKILSDTESLTASRLIKLYNYLDTTNIAAPKIIHEDLSHCFFNDEVIIQDFAEGVDLEVCLKQPHHNLKNLFQAVYEQIVEIHQLQPAAVHTFWYPDDWNKKEHPDWKRYILTELHLTTPELYKLDLPIKTLASIMRKLHTLEVYISKEDYQLVPLHGDLGPRNIIIDHKDHCKLVRIVDFERARIGDSLWDLVYCYGQLERLSTKLAENFKSCFWGQLSQARKSIFNCYYILFHAWSIRDMSSYKDNPKRTKLGRKSLKTLKQLV